VATAAVRQIFAFMRASTALPSTAARCTYLDTMPERYTKPVRLRLEMGRGILAEDYVRALAGREVLRLFGGILLAGPKALRRRDGLEVWYGGRREDPELAGD